MRAITYLVAASLPWVIAFIVPGYVRALNQPIRQEYMLTGADRFVCTITSADYTLRSLLIAAPIAIACILAIVIWAYFLSSRPDYVAKLEARRLRKIGFDAVRKGLK